MVLFYFLKMGNLASRNVYLVSYLTNHTHTHSKKQLKCAIRLALFQSSCQLRQQLSSN